MKKELVNNISAEVLSAYLEGNATAQESKAILEAISEDEALRELLHISQQVDAELGLVAQESDTLPMMAMAATCEDANYCCLECEQHLLRKFDIEFDTNELLANAVRNGWQKSEGTALHNIGRHLEAKGLLVMRSYNSTLEDIANALNANEGVIVAVDGGELLGNREEEKLEDVVYGPMPDHTVVVLSYDAEAGIVTLFDPNSERREDSYSVEQFEDAWCDSKNYLVTATFPEAKEYTPRPIDLSDVKLSAELLELREAIAENAHDVWALERKMQGWSYGPRRDDAKKQTPCMVAYSQLPDSEKTFDRDMAMNTLKLVQKLGYDIVKREK